jgi:hypothetical protein
MAKKAIIHIIKAYRMFLSPFLPSSCRFTPTCSEYGIEAVERYGTVRGLFLTMKRIARCHPFNPGGYDPVKERRA